MQAHMVEGGTPFLLSSKFLCDMDATINFRSGIAIFKRLSDQQFRLERSPSNHLLLPLTAFAGREDVLSQIWVTAHDETVAELSKAQLEAGEDQSTSDSFKGIRSRSPRQMLKARDSSTRTLMDVLKSRM